MILCSSQRRRAYKRCPFFVVDWKEDDAGRMMSLKTLVFYTIYSLAELIWDPYVPPPPPLPTDEYSCYKSNSAIALFNRLLQQQWKKPFFPPFGFSSWKDQPIFFLVFPMNFSWAFSGWKDWRCTKLLKICTSFHKFLEKLP